MVVKPSKLAPVAVLELARIFTAAGLPAGVLNVVCGLGAVAGKALAEHATVAKLDLTGGTETGMLAAAATGRTSERSERGCTISERCAKAARTRTSMKATWAK